MNRRKYISALLGAGSIGMIGSYKNPTINSRAELVNFQISNTDENNFVSLVSSSNEVNGINIIFNKFKINTYNIIHTNKTLDIKFYARMESNIYTDEIENISVNLSNESESINNLIDEIFISNNNLDGEFPTVDEESKKLYLKIEIEHMDFINKKIFETYIELNIEQKNIEIVDASGGLKYLFSENGETFYVHEYNKTGTDYFKVNNEGEIEVLLVGGGGGGGGANNGGGGGGAMDNGNIDYYSAGGNGKDLSDIFGDNVGHNGAFAAGGNGGERSDLIKNNIGTGQDAIDNRPLGGGGLPNGYDLSNTRDVRNKGEKEPPILNTGSGSAGIIQNEDYLRSDDGSDGIVLIRYRIDK